MRSGKISESILKRSVIKLIDYKNKNVIQGAGVGQDCSVMDVGDRYILTSTECALTGVHLGPYYAIVRAVNNIAACGGEPVSASVAFILKEDFDERRLKELTRLVVSACRECGIQLAGGHTEITSNAIKDMVSVTVTGFCHKERYRSLKAVQPGMDIIATGWIAMEQTAILLEEHSEELLNRLPESYVAGTAGYLSSPNVIREAQLAAENGAVGMHDVAEGGIFAALWEFAQGSGCGLSVNLRDIPVRQETVEFCEVFGLNPYQMPSTGSLLIAVNNGPAITEVFKQQGINAVVIGRTTADNDKKIINGDEVRFLDKP